MCPVIKSITFDNGSEFSGVEQILEILRKHTPDANIYYAHPYRSCERGSNERNHVFIRRMAPKGTKLYRMSPKRLQRTTDFTNAYPRQIFNGKSANDMWNEQIARLNTISA